MDEKYSKQDEKKLLKLARQSIEEEFSSKKIDNLEEDKFNEKKGVFVTLTKNNDLRGCIGFVYPLMKIKEAVIKAAKLSAFSDSRFLPLEEKELNDIKIEISVLDIPKEIQSSPKNLEIGKHGLICEYKGYSGLLLPQVAIEHNMNSKEFLETVCEKAGLSKNTWKEKDFKLYKFSCQIFSEKHNTVKQKSL
ncbi:MAG: AmmeMemoRadiSam system protein A [Nanoarchaeota archaeon]|nr:AmmeMemoRadiSam system protein A [Nanoarchaeota archaeon]